jgi:hypothetical protein
MLALGSDSSRVSEDFRSLTWKRWNLAVAVAVARRSGGRSYEARHPTIQPRSYVIVRSTRTPNPIVTDWHRLIPCFSEAWVLGRA